MKYKKYHGKKYRIITKQACPRCSSVALVWYDNKSNIRWCRECGLKYPDTQIPTNKNKVKE